ncbi:probable disease resistance protein At1g61180 isoform X2 [Capsella rubella]|uniref:probable disease resistance protein At1g61180 isoform X2 n=1 Tax=Capsella rubella TaxID=81985 RepID=UPI000CD599FB|nr:probable disease resistance protein At1g61180 isoform X2 [Capsella rubella]
MGSCFSIQVTVDGQTLNRIFRCLCGKGYIRTLKKNLRALQREMEDLRAIEDEVQNKVAREERLHQQRLKSVQLQKLCLCGLYSKTVCSSYSYGKRVFLLLEEVKQLISESNFDVVAEPAPRSEVEERPTQPTVGQELILKKAWNHLVEDGVGIMGLHGMGGVGKTTLFKKIHNKFAEMAGKFDVVIWVVVSQGVKTSKLQDDIAQKLHLCDEVWMNKNEGDKAAEMHRVLKKKRFVLMLDDIWEKVDLEAIGVPYPTRENGCKVAFTTRSQEVCGRMGDHEPMQVKCLERDEAWELFKNKVGDDTLRRDPLIVALARKVAEKCRGLPLALNVIGETMASKTTVQEWENAVDVLVSSAAEFSDMEDKILPVLKYSYDSLVDKHIKSCFLYCALFPEDKTIDKEELIDYWICEGYIGECQVIKRSMNKGYEILGTLIRSNLLTEVGTHDVVMHDVVREMALWITSCFGKQKETFIVQANVGLIKIPKVKDWGVVRKMSLMNNSIEEITCSFNCPELTTLFLQYNNLKNLSGEFLLSMQKLVVLDLCGNSSFKKFPEQISGLVSLQFLDLSHTSIVQLPVGFQELKRLTHLNLTSTKRLGSMVGISNLRSLKILKLLNSKVHGDVSLLKELQCLEHLQTLTITISTELGLEQILGDQRLANCITSLDISDFRKKPFDISLLVSMKNLNELWVVSCHVAEINTSMKCREMERDSSDLQNTTCPCFTNLSIVRIINCHSMKDLTWLLFAPNLVYLDVTFAGEVDEIINKEKAINFTGITITPFQNLQVLSLTNLPKLENIYWSPLPFPSLRRISAIGCSKLRKLPLNATSVPRSDEFSIAMLPPKQQDYLEWEDEDTKNRFLPSFSQWRR